MKKESLIRYNEQEQQFSNITKTKISKNLYSF